MSTIPPPLLLLLNSMRTSWNILVPPYLPATFGSDRMNDQEKSSSLSPQPPPSPVVAVVSDCKIEFLSTSGGNSAVGGHTSSVSLTRDVNSYLRVSTWFQSNLVAVCDSDGALHVVSYADGNGILLAQIMPQMPPPLAGHPKTAKSSPRVPSSIDPASVIFLIDPHLSRRGLLEAPLKNFTHELIVVCYNSTVRSYLLDVNTLMKMVKSTGGGSPVIVYRDEDPTGWPNCILPFHSLSFSKFSPTMSCAIIENQSLILAGCLSPTLDFNAEDIECESLFVFELCARFPYYITTSASRTSSSSIKQKPQIQQPVPLVESSKGMQFFKSVVGNITRSIMGSPFIYVLSMQFSRENNHFVLLDSSGRLMIVKSNSREIAHTWSITDLLINLRLDNTANESLMPNRVSWWSAFEIVISFTNGHLYILVMPEFINLLGDLPERFSAPITFNCTTGQECLYVLEEKRDECLARKQANGSYFIIRTGSDTELIGGGGSGGSSAALSPSTTSLNSASSSSTLITASTPLTWYQQIERIAAVASPLRFLVNAFLWHWDSDDVGATKVIKLSKRTMGLLLLAKSSPEEALTTRIANRDYQGALELAIGFSLETDLVYKAMWLDSSDVLDVHAFEKITDKSWVLDSCLRRVGLKSKSTKHLLQYGLNLTNATRLSDVVAELEAILSEIDIAATGSNEGVEHIPKIFYSNISLHSLCKYRIQFFKYLDRLESHTAIYGPLEEYPDLENPSALISFPVHFAKFRDMDMVDLAKFYALHGNIQSLKILFTRHGKELLPYRFILLDHMPETLKPSVYRLFLPIIDNGKEEMQFDIIPWRQRDWCEDKQVMEYCGWIENLDSELEDTVGGSSATSSDQVNRSDLAVESAVGSTAISPTLPAPFPATPDVVQCWYECRARFIESCTGQTDLAIELIKYGIQFNVSGLEKLDCNLGIINDLIYTCLEPESVVCAELDIQRIETMEPEDIVHLFLQDDDLNDDQIFGLMNGHILPYLKKLAVVDPLHATLSSTVICNYLQRVSTGRLGLSLTVFERFKESGDVFETHGHLIDTFVSCVYGFLNTAEYGSLIKRLRQLTTILQSSCAKQNGKSGFSQLGSSSKVATSSKLPSADGWETDLDLDTDTPSTHVAVINNQVEVERLATLAAHFNAFELLYRLGLVYSFLWLREVAADEKKQQKMVIDLVETLTGHKDHHYIVQDNVKPWNDVLYAIIELKNLSMLELVGLGWCISLLFEKSLMFGAFSFSGKLLREYSHSLSIEKVEEMCLQTSALYFDQAEEGRMDSGPMRMSAECLRVCLQSARCSIELEFITGLHQLSLLQPDITFVPSLVRESDDRVEFLQEVLLSNPNLYTSYDSILDITRKLVASKNIDKSLNRVKALLIETALKSDDTVVSWILCKEFLGAKKRKSQKQEGGGLWKLLVAISENSKFTDLDKKLQLLSQAVAICPTQEISYVLQLLKRADAEKAISSSGISQQGPAISSASSILKQQQHSSTSTTTRERIKSLIFGFDAVSLQYRGVSLENMVKDVMSLVVVDSGSKSSGSLLADLYSCDEFFFEKLSLDNGHNSTTNIKRNNIELDIFDTLHRVKSSNGGGDSCSPNSISTFDDEYEQHMLNISREFIDSDSPISAGYLLHISKDDDVEALFDSLEPSLRHEQLACYVFSLRFIQAAMIFYGYRGDCPVNLYQYAPQQVIKFVVNDAKGLIDQIPLECDGSKNRDKLQAKLDLVRKYCQLIIDKTQSRALQSVFEGVQIEFERFAIDPHYKISIVYSMMSSLDHELIMRSLAASDKLELDKEDLILAHFKWLFLEARVDYSGPIPTIIRITREVIRPDMANNIIHGLSTLSSSIFGFEKLCVYYTLLIDLMNQTTNHQDSIRQLEIRISFVQQLPRSLFPRSPSFGEHLHIVHSNITTLVEYMLPLSTLSCSQISSLSQFLSILVELRPMLIFEEEAQFKLESHVSKSSCNPVMQVVGSMLMNHFERGMCELEPDTLDVFTSLCGEIDSIVLTSLSNQQLVALVSLFSMSEKCIMFVAISERLAVFERVKQLSDEMGIDFRDDQLLKIGKHLNMIARLSEIQDPNNEEFISPERVGQIDMLFNSDPHKIVAILMKMIIAGNSPYVVTDAFDICCKYIPLCSTCKITDCSSLYKIAIECILGQQTSNTPYSTVFRSGVDSPVSAITRLVKSLKEYVVLSGRTDSSWATSDGEAVVQKDAGIETVIRLLETAAYESLRSAAKEGKLASAMQLDVLNIIEMYFDEPKNNIDYRLNHIKIANQVKESWGIEIESSVLSTPDNRRNFLTDLIGRSSEFAHFSSLAAIIVEFEEEELIVSEEDLTLDDGWGEAPTAVAAIEEEPAPASSRDDNWAHHWIMMMARSISLQHFDSLMLIVFECKRVYQFTEKVESELLNLLSRPPSASNNGYFIKLLLLSKQSILVEKGLVLLLETESSLSSWTNIDRSLHLILAGRGLLHHCTSVTTLWDSIHRTLLSVASLDGRQLSDKDGYKRIFYLALKKLRSSGRVSFACKLLFDYLKMPRVLLKGVGNTLGLLNHFLERNAAVLENAVSPLKPQIKVLDTGEFDLVIIVESLKL